MSGRKCVRWLLIIANGFLGPKSRANEHVDFLISVVIERGSVLQQGSKLTVRRLHILTSDTLYYKGLCLYVLNDGSLLG